MAEWRTHPALFLRGTSGGERVTGVTWEYYPQTKSYFQYWETEYEEDWYDDDTGVWRRVKWTIVDVTWKFKRGKVVIEEEWGWQYIEREKKRKYIG